MANLVCRCNLLPPAKADLGEQGPAAPQGKAAFQRSKALFYNKKVGLSLRSYRSSADANRRAFSSSVTAVTPTSRSALSAADAYLPQQRDDQPCLIYLHFISLVAHCGVASKPPCVSWSADLLRGPAQEKEAEQEELRQMLEEA